MTFPNLKIGQCNVLEISPPTGKIHFVFRVPKSNPPSKDEIDAKTKTVFQYLDNEGFFGKVKQKWSIHTGVILE